MPSLRLSPPRRCSSLRSPLRTSFSLARSLASPIMNAPRVRRTHPGFPLDRASAPPHRVRPASPQPASGAQSAPAPVVYPRLSRKAVSSGRFFHSWSKASLPRSGSPLESCTRAATLEYASSTPRLTLPLLPLHPKEIACPLSHLRSPLPRSASPTGVHLIPPRSLPVRSGIRGPSPARLCVQ